MKPFWNSTTAQFGVSILTVGALAAGFSDYTWTLWMDQAIIIIGIYASKEGVRYGAEAYSNRPA